jgi:2'-5' RNA ligase
VLYVVAWPILSEADDQALRRLRAQYHPTEAAMIGPHFTLVFGAADAEEARLRTALAGIVQRPFWFMIDRIGRRDLWLYAEPSDGADELRALHEALNDPAGEFVPHSTLGRFGSAVEAEQVARIVERQHLPMRGRIEQLALLKRSGDALETLATRPLGG